MKLKALLLTLCTAGLMVSVAVAASPQDKGGKPGQGKSDPVVQATTGTTTGEREHGKGAAKGHEKKDRACKSARKLQFQGEFVAAGAGGFAMTVKKGNHHAKALVGKQVSILVDAKTRFHGKKKALADLVAGDRLTVQADACRADATPGQAAATSFLARKVGVKGAKSGDDDKDETTTTSTSSTTTTGTTTGS